MTYDKDTGLLSTSNKFKESLYEFEILIISFSFLKLFFWVQKKKYLLVLYATHPFFVSQHHI